MTDPRTDDDLMLAFAGGAPDAFEVLYERYRKPLYRYLYHAVGDKAAADDLYQDVWSRIIDARARFRRGNGFKRWAFRIAHNRLVDHWRALDRQPGMDADRLDGLPGDEKAAPEAVLARNQQADELRQALMQLPPAQREAFLLQQEAGLSLADIAARESVGRETVKSRLRYAVGKLRGILAPDPEAAGK
ncbi:MAG: sigma-70 family RNA polymerase sigma factor [Wenzhouxiangellaceae bacterium]|jgi:RNA polymerase sigma-70 factor (ECF subfamily)|nr:sigma-70 family RNA polymerase sigma factor [Wenzhouxiangellaceae bacterium]MBS3745791.1 sigma-70 family RNA polymerase sigma factor [Wenzhouxiangellaceae bacterium]MBS3824041.1 sigma-70 family RNA polymerase sigma factor [Wenzhouxiangellaceae bacterium]